MIDRHNKLLYVLKRMFVLRIRSDGNTAFLRHNKSDNSRGKDGKFSPLLGGRMDPEDGKESADSKEVAETPAEVAEPMEVDGDKQQVRGRAKDGA